MHLASLCTAAGADFTLLGADRTMLRSHLPVIAVTAVRTGAGKSQTTRYLSRIVKSFDRRVVAIRHPMPYGDLAAQACQRFATYDDLTTERTTIEEREEYEPHIDNGFVVFAGVDYERILCAAEKEADIILWDGGNNDLPFYTPSLHICVADPLRSGHEAAYWPGEANFRRADLIIINKCDSAEEKNIVAIEKSAARLNPRARVVRAASPVTMDKPELVRGKRVLVIEDGPTLTHGGMTYGAGFVAARREGAEIVDPRPFAVGSILETYAKYPNASGILPAMGYGDAQIRELEETIRRTPCDAVVVGTPIDLRRVLTIDKPAVRVRYELKELVPGVIEEEIRRSCELQVASYE
jgi:predicted GTPase